MKSSCLTIVGSFWSVVYILFLICAVISGLGFVLPIEYLIQQYLLVGKIPPFFVLCSLGGGCLIGSMIELKGFLNKYEGFADAINRLDGCEIIDEEENM